MNHLEPRNEKPPLKPRLACDRCHSQKLRCLRPQGRESSRCQRCLSSNTECVFSPRARSTRSKRQRTDSEDDIVAEKDMHPVRGMATDGDPPQARSFDHGVCTTRPSSIQDGGMGQLDESMDFGSYFDYAQPNGKGFGSPLADWSVPDYGDLQNFGALGAPNGEHDFTGTASLLDPVLQGLIPSTTAQWPLTLVPSNPEQSSSASPSSGEADSEEEISLPIAHYIRKLADLNVSLYEHATTIPPQSATSDSQVAQMMAASAGSSKRKTFSKLPTQEDIEKGKMFAIDQTFKLTQTLIEILVRLYPRFDSRVVQHEADLLPFLSLRTAENSTALAPELLQTSLGSLNSYQRREDSINNKSHQSQTCSSDNPPLDQGTVLLILSCYHRLVDIYDGIFGHMQACIKHSITPVTVDGQTFRLPPLKVGEYVAPASAAIAMQMMLVIRMSSQLFNQMQEVMGVGNMASTDPADNAVRGVSSRPQSGFTDMACHAMQMRACSMSERISSTRVMLLQSGVI